MIKSKMLVIIGLAILLVLNVFLLYRTSILTIQLKNEHSKHVIEVRAMKTQFLEMLKIGSKTISIPELKGINSPLFCYYASDVHCHSCVDSAFGYFNKFVEAHKGIRSLLLVNYKKEQDLVLFLRLHQYTGEKLKVSDEFISDSNQPMFFIYHPDKLMATDFFIPNKNNVDVTNKYMDVIFRKYFLLKH